MKTNDMKTPLNKWFFQIDQRDVGETEGWYGSAYDRSSWMPVEVPGAWDHYEYAMRNYQGVGWYCTDITAFTGEDLWHLLEFTGVGGRAWVWINGEPAHYNAIRYLPFCVDAQPFLHPGRNTVVVRVDNRPLGVRQLPGARVLIEWVLYGGMIHKVELTAAPVCRVERVEIKAVPQSEGGHISVKAFIVNHGEDFVGTFKLSLDTADGNNSEAAVICPRDQGAVIELELNPSAVVLWSPDQPALYTLTGALTDGRRDIHVIRERFGFRTIERHGDRILLNGKPIFFKGINRYDEYEPYGSSAPDHIIHKDLEHIKRCGANLVRMHYQQDPIHMEIADELGLMYMQDVPLCWWHPEDSETLGDYPELRDEALDDLERTYRIYCNHPSWVIWSMSNECGTQKPAGTEMMCLLRDRARALDCGRLITWALDHMPSPGEIKDVDMISIQPYQGSLSFCGSTLARNIGDLEACAYQATVKYVAEAATNYPGMPVLISEFGAISICGLRGDMFATEDFHAEYLKTVYKAFTENESVAGTILWCWADYFHKHDFILGSECGVVNTAFGPFGIVTVDRKIKNGPYKALLDMYLS